MSQFTDTLEETAKNASSRIADTARAAGEHVEDASRVASKKVGSAYSSALGYAMTGLKLVPTVTSALGYLGLQRKRRHTAGYMMSFGAGLAVGAGAGLLFAPRSGRELRDTLWGYLRGGDARAAADEVKNAASEVTEKVEEKAAKVVDAAKNFAHETNQKAKDAATQTSDQVKRAAVQAADKVDEKAHEMAKRIHEAVGQTTNVTEAHGQNGKTTPRTVS